MANEFVDGGNCERQHKNKPWRVTKKNVHKKLHFIDAIFLSLHLHHHIITLLCIYFNLRVKVMFAISPAFIQLFCQWSAHRTLLIFIFMFTMHFIYFLWIEIDSRRIKVSHIINYRVHMKWTRSSSLSQRGCTRALPPNSEKIEKLFTQPMWNNLIRLLCSENNF